jgi:transporter family-2 protein
LMEKQLTLPRVFGALLLIAGVVLIQFGGVFERNVAVVG